MPGRSRQDSVRTWTPAMRSSCLSAGQRILAFGEQRGDDLGDRLFLRDHADRLSGHDGAALDVAVDHRAAQRACPEMLDLELRLTHVDLALVEQPGDLDLLGGEFLAAL